MLGSLMCLPLRWSVAALAACVAVAPICRALEAINESDPNRREFGQAVQRFLAKEEFAVLDQMADKMRVEQSRMTEGIWKLGFFYMALQRETVIEMSDDFPAAFARFERWERANPSSITARIAHAAALGSYAWVARGDGMAHTVTAEGWKLFEQRLKQARALLESDEELKKCPGYYSTMMTVALGQGWSRRDYDRLFAEAVALAPDYETFYFHRAIFLQEKWYGTSPDEWHRFALAAADATKKEHGQILYTRIVWYVLRSGMTRIAAVKKTGFDWPRMKEGFEELARRYPESVRNKNAFCFYAYAADDKTTARRLSAELGGRYAPEVWGKDASFRPLERWLKSDTPAPKR